MANHNYSITELCKVFDLSISTYYDRIIEKPIAMEKEKIITIIKKTAIETKYSYGKRRMHNS